METILKAAAGVLIVTVFFHILSKQGKDISVLLVIAVCCMVFGAAFWYLQPVVSFFEHLQLLGKLNPEMLNILMKSVGIGLLTEITSLICKDMGNTALGKSLQLLSASCILWLALPLFNKLLELIETVLGEV